LEEYVIDEEDTVDKVDAIEKKFVTPRTLGSALATLVKRKDAGGASMLCTLPV